MGKKVISNTFTVNTIEDGTFPQQIFYRNQNNQEPSTPATSQSDAVPSGWSATPKGVGGVYKYEWVSMRTKSNGVWGVYSTPALYAYLAEDGTSFNIKGSAITLEIGDVLDVQSAYEQQSELSKTEKGDIILGSATHSGDGDHYILRRTDKYWDEDTERYAYFFVESVQEGEAYVISAKQSVPTSYDGHFFLASPRDDDAASGIYYWKDLGYLKGVKGDDAVMYVLKPSIPQFNTDQGRTKTQTCIVRAYKIEGKTKSAFTGCFEIMSVVPDGQIQPMSQYQWGNNVSFGTNKTNNATSYVVRLWDKNPQELAVGEPEPVLLASITIPIAFDGTQGERGKIGRFFYFGGVFNSEDNDPTHGFVVNDAQAPYFEHTENGKKRYHVFNYDTNGTYTMAQMWAISSNWNNKPWEVMTNDFKYIITQALFADFAKLGSWVFSGDYMLSQTGVDGTTNYQNFTGESGAWQPNLYMNALTGRLVGNNVNLRGVFNSYDAIYWNGIEMNAKEGYFKMSGPDVVEYDGKPSSGASIVDLFKIEFKDKEGIVEGEQTVRCIRMTIGDEDLNHIRIDSNDYFDGAVIRLGNSSKGAAVGTNLDDGDIPKMKFWDNYYNPSGEQRSVELNAEGVRFKGGDGNYGNVRLTNEGVEVYNTDGTIWAFKSWGRIIGFES